MLLLTLFLLSLSGEALHTLNAHHDAGHCSICTFQAHDVGADVHAESAASGLFISHEAPPLHIGLPHRTFSAQTLFGRAPPLLHS